MNWIARLSVLLLLLCLAGAATAAPFSTDTHDVYAGDFNGDGKSDLLVIAKDASALSGIYATDASGQPSTLLQSWNSGFLGISWHESRYVAVVGNFDGVNGDDVLLQRRGAGVSFLLPTNAQGELYGISQYLNGWGTDAYRILAGKFNGDARADVFLQASKSSINSLVVLSDGAGHLTLTNQSWPNDHLAFKWSVSDAIVHVGDFNGDGRDDLLVQAKPQIVLVDYDIPIPVPVYPPNAFGITLATPAGQFVSIHDVFSRRELGLDFAPSEVELVVADVNGDGRDDIVLLSRKSGTSYVVLTDGNGQLTNASVVNLGAGTLGAELRTFAADFNGDGRAELYRVAGSGGGSNSIVSFNSSGGISANQTHTPPPLASTAAANAVGKLPVALSVDDSGAGQVDIPFDLPEGTAGLTPSLGLTYSSNAGDSLVGVGWSIRGLSAITRCARTWAQDGAPRDVRNDASDRFCLDGAQLRLVSGSYGAAGASYRTELESFSRVSSYGSAGNGPASFVVETKGGLISEYGASEDSRIESLGQPTARTWALNRIRDRSGNVVDFQYFEDAVNGSYRISSVIYSRHVSLDVVPAYRVEFSYESKPSDELDSSYMAGSVIRQVTRLKRVEVLYNTSTLLRRYDLGYEPALSSTRRSRLRSVQLCAGAAAECLPATTFTYQDGTAGLGGQTSTVAVNAPLPLDVNGDGRDDLVYSSSANSGAGTWRVMLAQEGGYQAAIDTGIANTAFSSAFAIDYNADGADDLLVPYSGNTWWVLLGTSSGLAAPINTGAPVTTTGRGLNARALDVNGDGLEDLVWADLVGYGGGDAIRYRLREISGAFSTTASMLVGPYPADFIINDGVFAPGGQPGPRRIPDFNGDGRGDLFVKNTQRIRVDNEVTVSYRFLTSLSVQLSGGGSFGTAAASGSMPYFGDFNGDGKSDLVYYNSAGAIVLQFSTGTGFAQPLGTGAVAPYGPRWLVMDWDSDGYDDLLLRETASGTVHLLRSTGEALEAPLPTGLSIGNPELVADIDGDGLLDLGATSSGVYSYRLHPGAYPDLLKSATDGYGQVTTFQYAPLPRANYTKESGASFPEQDYQGPIYVVNSTTQANGVGGTYTNTFAYYGARMHLQGRGFEGFRGRRTIDSRDGLQLYEYFNRSFPYTGTPSQVDVFQPNGSTLIARVQNTWNSFAYGSGVESRVLAYPSASTATAHEVGGPYDGALLSTLTTTTLVDGPTGTLYDTTRTLTEAASANGLNPGQSYTQRTLLPLADLFTDVPNWCLGRAGRVQQINSHSIYGGQSQTRTVSTAWDGALCRPTQSVIEPNHPTLQVTEALDYDSFGNLKSSSLTPVTQSTRVSRIDWGSDGRFPRTLTNPLSQITTLEWLADSGLLRRVSDPNGLIASNDYDAFGRLTVQTQPDGTSTRTQYLGCDADCVGTAYAKFKIVSTARDAATATIAQSFTVFDAYERPRRSSSYALNGDIITQLTDYGADARVQRVSVPFISTTTPVWTSFTYDLLGRQRQAVRDHTSDLDATTSTATFDYEGLTLRSTDALGKVRLDSLSALGQVVKSIQAVGTPAQTQLSYDYDAFNNLVRTTDPAGNQIVVGYNVRGFKTSSSDPDTGTWSYDYYALGELKGQTDAKAQLTSFTYDSLSRPLTRTEPADSGTGMQTTSWTWGVSASNHNIGQLQSVSLGGYAESYAYDILSRLSSVAVTAEGTTYTVGSTYNGAGQLDTLTYPQSTGSAPLKVKYEYDTSYRSGLLRKVSDANSGATFWQASTTTAFDQYPEVSLGNGLRTQTQFDSITGDLNRLDTTSSGTSRQSLQYQWDKLGNLTSRQDLTLGKTETFSYDALYRMTQAAVSGGTALTVAYNAVGNITSKSDVGSYAYSATQKHAVISAGTNTYSYDANGNAITRNGASLAWTAYNLPKLINASGGNSSQFLYGPDRQRYKHVAVNGAATETTIYVQGIFEKLTRGTLTEYKHSIAGPDGVIAIHTRRSNGTNETIYPLRDHLGSTDVITDNSGAVLAKLSFTPFGARRNGATWSGAPSATDLTAIANTTRRGFTDHEQLDNLNLVHMNGRVYDPVVGRFISADPFVANPADSQSFNRYSYVGNNPLSFTDPSGFTPHRPLYRYCQVNCYGGSGNGPSAADRKNERTLAQESVNRLQLQQILERQRAAQRRVRDPVGSPGPTRGEVAAVPNVAPTPGKNVVQGRALDTGSAVDGFPSDREGVFLTVVGDGIAVPTLSPGLSQSTGDAIERATLLGVLLGSAGGLASISDAFGITFSILLAGADDGPPLIGPLGGAKTAASTLVRAETVAAKELSFGRKLDFLFNRNIDQSVARNAARARGNANRMGIADTPANRQEVARRFNEAFNDPSSIVGPGNLPGSNLREFFLPGITSTGSKIQFVELDGKVITIIAQ